MAEIDEILIKILKSRYGKDVRQAIHDGIERCYDFATTAPDGTVYPEAYLRKDGDGKNVTVTFQQAVARANVQSGDSLEVAMGKISKYFSDILPYVYEYPIANLVSNDSTHPLAASAGKNLNDQINVIRQSLNSKIITQEGNVRFYSTGDKSYGYINVPNGYKMINVYMQEVTGNVGLRVAGFNKSSANGYTVWVDFGIDSDIYLHWVYYLVS